AAAGTAAAAEGRENTPEIKAGREDRSAVAASEALGIVARSGVLPPADLLRGAAAVSRGACRAHRAGRTFHVRVTAHTPQRVWSPPSPPPPAVGGGTRALRAGRGRGEEGGRGSVPMTTPRAETRVPPLRVSHITWDRTDRDLGDDFALELPLDLEKLTFSFAFNRSLDGVDVDWPPGMKVLHFGMAFNPRPLSRPAPPRPS
ncbi:unnamed protein product, partial [Hapterophycus canaliculatus]